MLEWKPLEGLETPKLSRTRLVLAVAPADQPPIAVRYIRIFNCTYLCIRRELYPRFASGTSSRKREGMNNRARSKDLPRLLGCLLA
jgi:hypothetical protein